MDISLYFKLPKNKHFNNNYEECLNIEIVRKTSKNVIISCIYKPRPPGGDTHKFLGEMKDHIIKNKFQEKPLFRLGDLNMNSLDCSRNTHVRGIFTFVFQNDIFPVISRPTRVTKSRETVIDHILTKTIVDSHIQNVTIKTYASDHFAVFCLINTNLEQTNIKKTIIKRDINKESMKYFKTIFNSTDWELLPQTLSQMILTIHFSRDL